MPSSVTFRACARLAAVAALLTGLALAGPAPARACDICSIYTATEGMEGQRGFRFGLAEQYTQFATEQFNGEQVANPFGEHLYSSNTQVFAGYQFNKWVGLQVNLPVLLKNWRRVAGGGEIQKSTRGGIGDLSLISNVLVYDNVSETGVFRFGLLGGLEFPSGDAGFLKEELDEGGDEAAGLARPQHEAAVPSGVHGHDLTFGSGSVDGIVGGQLYWSYQRFFFTTVAQYKITTVGSFDYQFANDLTWLGGPGYYVLAEHGYTLGLQAVLTGETKGNDEQNGVKSDDTAITALYVGPGIDFTYGMNLSAELGADLPAVQNNTALQIVPDFRLRGALVWRF